MEPLYEGEPILAVAAVDELTAAEAIEKIVIEFEPLPFSVDPIASLRPGSPNARTQGNAWVTPTAPPAAAAPAGGAAPAGAAAGRRRRRRRGCSRRGAAARAGRWRPAGSGRTPQQAPQRPRHPPHRPRLVQQPARPQARRPRAADRRRAGEGRGAGRGGPGGAAPAGPPRPEIQELKWTAEDFAAAQDGQMPMGKPTARVDWSANIEEGFKQADLVLDETFVSQSTGHQPLETRTAMAYWQNGKLYLHGSTQSTVQTVGSVARWVGIPPTDVVLDQRVHGRRLRQQDSRLAHDGDSGAALEEDQRAGADAHHARGRALHRPRASGHSLARQGRLPQGRPDHRDRPLHGRGQRSVRSAGRFPRRRPARSRCATSRRTCGSAASRC